MMTIRAKSEDCLGYASIHRFIRHWNYCKRGLAVLASRPMERRSLLL